MAKIAAYHIFICGICQWGLFSLSYRFPNDTPVLTLGSPAEGNSGLKTRILFKKSYITGLKMFNYSPNGAGLLLLFVYFPLPDGRGSEFCILNRIRVKKLT